MDNNENSQPRPYDSDIPASEIEAAADALKALWESEENRESVRKTGHGAAWWYQAKVALEAARSVRGKNAHGMDATTDIQ